MNKLCINFAAQWFVTVKQIRDLKRNSNFVVGTLVIFSWR